MRIPIPIAITLSLVACAVTWWLGTKNKDFLTPPAHIAASPAVLPPAEPSQTPQEAPPTPGEEAPVALDTFADQAAMGSAHLIQLARSLQNAQWHHLAWLAWERVLDATTATPEEISLAIDSIGTLRTNPDASARVIYPQEPFPIVIRAGTARKHAAAIQPILERAARDVESAAKGILKVSAHITGGNDPTGPSGNTPVAIWITGPDAGSRSSEVLSFTLRPGADLNQRVDSTVSQLLRSVIARSIVKPPPAPSSSGFPQEMTDCFTRRSWFTVGNLLNLPVEENP